MKLSPKKLHERFIELIEDDVIQLSDISKKPLEVDLKQPLPSKIRLYIFNMTDPPGGRTLGEMKVQLILPGQQRGTRADFDTSDGRIVLLAGYNSFTDVFVFWDAGMYYNISYSRNVQAYTEAINEAIAGNIAEHKRKLWEGGWEISIAVRSDKLKEAIQRRVKRTIERISGEYTDA
jgi:hypothetical protein